MKKKFIDYFCKIAEHTAALSYAKRLKVGTVIVRDNRILSIGYNGTPSGWDNECEQFNGSETKPEVIHAEANALMKLTIATESSLNATMFCTHAPCIDCAKLIYQAGVKNVFYINDYRSDQGLKFLEKAGVEICQVK